jgi:hypothetical protein
MEKIVNIQNVDPNTLQLQNYSSADESLISNFITDVTFNPSEDYLEYFILDLNQNILFSNTAGYPGYQIQDNNVIIDPQNDLESQGFEEGQYYTIYNFLKRKLSSSPNSAFYIQDISTDRTELRLNTTTIFDIDVVDLTTQFAAQISNATGSYLDFYLNFGDNKLVIANNIALDNTNPDDPTVLIKLYEPLSEEFTFQSQCWIVEQIAESQAYQIELTTVFTVNEQLNYIGGPNFNLNVQDQINNTTTYQNQNTLKLTNSTQGSGSLMYQINSMLAEKGIEINVDYSKYSQFVHFSSAQTRLENFYYKLALIEEYTVSSSYSSGSSESFTLASGEIWDSKINEIITHFDGYEYYLYYESGSHTWPKINSTAPYINYSVNDIVSINWLSSQIPSASFFDSENNDALVNAIPAYLREDSTNDQYMLFIQMIGQHFDNVWIYLKDITNKFDADNRLNFGISKDIVAQAIRDLGVKIYQNNFSSTDLYSALLGLTPSGSNTNVPYITGSLPTPTGWEYINLFVTASDPNALEPLDDINKEIYKRIYHNLPYLLKKKGTPESLRVLSTIYGIPDTIFRINEFSGKTSTVSNNWDNFQNQFNYEFFTTSSGYIEVPLLIDTGSGNGRYGAARYGQDYYNGDSFNEQSSSFTIEFRFKTTGIPTNPTQYDQILAYSPENNFALVLEYTGTGYVSGSYDGSIPDPYNEYGDLKFIDLNTGVIEILYLPFFDGEWWSVMYNLGDEITPITDWVLDFQPLPGKGIWEDGGVWYDTETWYDAP